MGFRLPDDLLGGESRSPRGSMVLRLGFLLAKRGIGGCEDRFVEPRWRPGSFGAATGGEDGCRHGDGAGADSGSEGRGVR